VAIALFAAIGLLLLFAGQADSDGGECTIKWVGPSKGSWTEEASWSPYRMPGASDRVCIPAGVTVDIGASVGSVRSVQSQGTLSLVYGELSLTSTEEPSHTARFTQRGGTLTGAATLTVTEAAELEEARQTEGGTTEIAPAATLSITAGGEVANYLEEGRILRIDSGAKATLAPGVRLQLGQGARVVNLGNVTARGGTILAQSGGGATLYNAGTFTHVGEETLQIAVPFENGGALITRGTVSLASYRQGPGAVLHLYVGEFGESGFSQLIVEGIASLAGALQVSTEGGFKAEAGQSFRTISAGTREGAFEALEETGGGLGAELKYRLQYDGTGATLVVSRSKGSTALSTVLAGEGHTGESLTVKEGAAVSDKAALTGANASGATGSVSYAIYSDSGCAQLLARAGSASVAGGVAGPSEARLLPVGTYYWQASYSGDTNNEPSGSACGAEVETVRVNEAHSAPKVEVLQPTGATQVGAQFAIIASAQKVACPRAGCPLPSTSREQTHRSAREPPTKLASRHLSTWAKELALTISWRRLTTRRGSP
jgi:hypothetical protein